MLTISFTGYIAWHSIWSKYDRYFIVTCDNNEIDMTRLIDFLLKLKILFISKFFQIVQFP